jgi:3-(3-hydroxy-phenyl)propionate hydroxylase
LPNAAKERLDATGALAPELIPTDADADRLASMVEAVLPGAVRIWRVTDAPSDGGPSLTEAYGRTRPAFYLLRPDGYICARGRPSSDAAGLVRHCETWFAKTRQHV